MKVLISDVTIKEAIEGWLNLEGLADRNVTVTDRAEIKEDGPLIILYEKNKPKLKKEDAVCLPLPLDLAKLSEAIRSFEPLSVFSTRERDAEPLIVKNRMISLGEKHVALTEREFALFLFMIENNGKIVSRSEISSSVWANDTLPDTNNIDVYVSYLRKKINTLLGPGSLVSVRGQGYLFTTDKTISIF